MIKDLLKKENIEFKEEDQSKDWSFVSPVLSKIPRKRAEVVAYPTTEEDVIKIVEKAIEDHVPIIPKGAGYGTVGGLIPLREGSIVIDMSRMNSLTEDEEFIYAEAGARFNEDFRVYPTIWQKATVGGYFCGGSWGIGSYEYGVNWDQVVEVRMINPKGKVVTLKGGDVKIAAHAEGTTGIVTKLKILRKPKREEISKIVEFDDLGKGIKFIQRLYDETFPAYHITLRSPEMAKLTEKLTGFSTDKWHALIVYDKNLGNIEGKDGSALWNKRNLFFAGVYVNTYLSKGGGVYYTQYHIPLEEFESKIIKVKELSPIIEAEFASDRKAHTYFLFYDEDKFYTVNRILGTSTFDLHSVTINSRLSRDHLQRIIWYKKSYDKEDLFNPGKVSLD
ncbi:MAG: FAD-binding oxidoreductase [Sulfolobus sp.]